MRPAAALVRIDTALGDAGYAAEHNHRLCREDLGVRETVIRLNRRNTGRRWPKSPYRRGTLPALRRGLMPGRAVWVPGADLTRRWQMALWDRRRCPSPSIPSGLAIPAVSVAPVIPLFAAIAASPVARTVSALVFPGIP
jgi:hypothetical protein